ncbi:hypothetical protein D3C75_96980 [compost metagenome]
MTLIRHQIWDNATLERFSSWKKQFEKEEEQLIAAYMAQQLIYYNKKDFISIITQTVAQSFRLISNMDPRCVELNSMNDALWAQIMEETKRNILVCPLTIDSPAASGFMVTRLLRDQGIIAENELCKSYDELIYKLKRRTVKAVIFVDDMIGSGTQAKEALVKPQDLAGGYQSLCSYLKENYTDIPLLLAVAIAPSESKDLIEKETGLSVLVGETLLNEHDVLHNDYWKGINYDDGMQFLEFLNKKWNIPIKNFGTHAWAVAFEHGVPDVSAPFYYANPEGWTSLIRQRGEDL